MSIEAYKQTIFYPLTLWLLFTVVGVIFGYTNFPDIANQMLLNNSAPYFIAVGFGLWIGAAASKDTFGLRGTVINAFIVSFVVGLSVLVATIMLINTSPIFVTYATSIYARYATVNEPIMNLAVSTMFGDMFVALPAAAAAHLFLRRRSTK